MGDETGPYKGDDPLPPESLEVLGMHDDDAHEDADAVDYDELLNITTAQYQAKCKESQLTLDPMSLFDCTIQAFAEMLGWDDDDITALRIRTLQVAMDRIDAATAEARQRELLAHGSMSPEQVAALLENAPRAERRRLGRDIAKGKLIVRGRE
jgi:hypothetical protein